jgi:hypothetical protein
VVNTKQQIFAQREGDLTFKTLFKTTLVFFLAQVVITVMMQKGAHMRREYLKAERERVSGQLR